MIIPDHKKLMTILVNKRNAKGEKVAQVADMQPESSRYDEHPELQSHAENLIAAIHEKSPHKVIEALQAISTPKAKE